MSFFCSENCVSVYFYENRSRVCFVVPSCCFLVIFVVENPTAATSSLFSYFPLRLCKAGPVLQPKGGEHTCLSSRRRDDPSGPASSREAVPVVKIRVFARASLMPHACRFEKSFVYVTNMVVCSFSKFYLKLIDMISLLHFSIIFLLYRCIGVNCLIGRLETPVSSCPSVS